MSSNARSGSFANFYLNLKNSQDGDLEKTIEKISTCRDDFERMAFLDGIEYIREQNRKLHIHRQFDGKDAEIASDHKEKGNMAFKSKDWLEAMVLYTKSYIALPAENVAEQALVIANRSATLYHMQKYDEALIDIKRAMSLGYPKNLIYKLYERAAKCYLAKKNYPKTIESFKKCITAMDDANLPSDKHGKMQLDAMAMVKMLDKDPETKKQSIKMAKMGEQEPTLCIPDEKEFISTSVRFDYNKIEGHFARAGADIKVGEEILVEKPFVAVLLERFSKTHCENCFIRTALPVACPKCADIIYCSEKCLGEAASKYHKYECGIVSTIWRSGASVNCHMAYRIIASKPLDYFMKLKDQINQVLTIEETQKLPKDDYRRMLHLVRHEEARTPSNFFQHTLMAHYLLKCFEAADYFTGDSSSETRLTIGALLLRNLQFTQYNTHEVSELNKSLVDGKEKSVFIGGALYPNLALFNHSCDPGVVRYFRGTTIHVNTIKPIESGLPISENYGAIYTTKTREERQTKLRELYCFDCTCDACLENWPTFDKLPSDIIRFRCDAPNKCTSVIEVPGTCNDFMIKCVACGESTKIFKGLKVMQDTELMIRTGKRLYEAGEFGKALNKFLDLVKIMFEVLAPPFTDFCECQQYLKDCFLHLGNFYELA